MKEKDVYREEVFKTWRKQWKHFYISGPSGIGKSKFAKDLARKK